MATGFVVSSLTSFKNEFATDLIGKILWAGDSLKLFKKMPGITYTGTINYFDVSATMQIGAFCSPTTTGTTTLEQKVLTVCEVTYQGDWCPSDIQKKYNGYLMEKNVKQDSVQPFETVLLDQVKNYVLQQTELNVWSNSANTTCMGLYYQLSADTARNIVSATTTVTSSNVQSVIQAMINSMNTNAPNITQDDELTLFVSPSVYAMLQQSMFNSNNFGVPLFNDNGDLIIDFWGPRIAVHKTYGWSQAFYANSMLLTTLKNLYHGFTGEGEEEGVDLFYDALTNKLYWRVNFRLGVTFWDASYTVTNF